MNPTPATWEQIRDFADWVVGVGCGKDTAMLDRRGMEHLVLPRHVGQSIGLALPLEDESGNPDLHQIYLRASFA